MPQLDKFTYLTQFFWFSLFFFSFYFFICNYGDGFLGISRILKLRNQLLSHRGNNIQSKDPNPSIYLKKGFSTGLSYMYSSLFEVSQWCQAECKRMKITFFSCFGEISGSRGMEKKINDFFSKSSYSTSSNPGWAIRNDIIQKNFIYGKENLFSLFFLIFFMASFLFLGWYPFLVLLRALGPRIHPILTFFIGVGDMGPGFDTLVSHLTEEDQPEIEPEGSEESVNSRPPGLRIPTLSPEKESRISFLLSTLDQRAFSKIEGPLREYCCLPATIDRFPSLAHHNLDYSSLIKPMLGDYPFFVQNSKELDILLEHFCSGRRADIAEIHGQFHDFLRLIL